MLCVENLKKQYASSGNGTLGGGVLGASFEVKEGELFTLLGPSGCGKTTTLRSIAGLEEPSAGHISIGSQTVFCSDREVSIPLYQRDIGMVFQSYAIWPHMTVFENAAYPLRVSRSPRRSKEEIKRKVEATLEVVGLGELAHRQSTQLSGGQQQRLALARALTREPALLLLDEPLSNLDAKLRDQMRSELKTLQRESGVTSIYVTHDQAEALAISDRIAVMNAGRIVQIASPRDIYERPACAFVASFIGKTNTFRGTIRGRAEAGGYGEIQTPVGPFRCSFRTPVEDGSQVAFVVRPENVRIFAGGEAPGGPSVENLLRGHVQTETYLGEIVELSIIAADDSAIVVRTYPGHAFQPGETVTLQLPAEHSLALVES